MPSKGAWHIWNMDDGVRRQIKAGAAACGMTLPAYLAALNALRSAMLALINTQGGYGPLRSELVRLGLMPAGIPK